MSDDIAISVCPAESRREALETVLRSVADQQRSSLIDGLRPLAAEGVDVFAGLVVAHAADRLAGAAWLQPQVGRTATLWPPRAAGGHDPGPLRRRLAQQALAAAEPLSVALVQTLLESDTDPLVGDLQSLGFSHLANLQYLMLPVPRRVVAPPAGPLELIAPALDDRPLLERLLVATYQNTLDCPALEGLRSLEDIIEGYQAVGSYDASLWFTACWDGQPAGVLLMAPHPDQDQWELVYMGVAPEFRGKGVGSAVLAEMRFRASAAGVEHVVLAVDSTNVPAVKIYERAGFVEWARRCAYIKSTAKPKQSTKPLNSSDLPNRT